MIHKTISVPIQVKQKKLREHIPQSEFQQFGTFCLEYTGNTEIQNWSLEFIDQLIAKYQIDKTNQQQQYLNDNPSQKSYAQYQISYDKFPQSIKQQSKNGSIVANQTNKKKQFKQKSIISEAYEQSESERYHFYNQEDTKFKSNNILTSQQQQNKKKTASQNIKQTHQKIQQRSAINRIQEKKQQSIRQQKMIGQNSKQAIRGQIKKQQTLKQKAKIQQISKEAKRQQPRSQQVLGQQKNKQGKIYKQLIQFQKYNEPKNVIQQLPSKQYRNNNHQQSKLGFAFENSSQNSKQFAATTDFKRKNQKTTNELIEMLLSPDIERKNKNQDSNIINEINYKTQQIKSVSLYNTNNFWNVPQPSKSKQSSVANSKKFLQFQQFHKIMQQKKHENQIHQFEQKNKSNDVYGQNYRLSSNKPMLNFDDIFIEQLPPSQIRQTNISFNSKISQQKKKIFDKKLFNQQEIKIKPSHQYQKSKVQKHSTQNKHQKILYQGPIIFRQKFQDNIPCFKSPIRKQLYSPFIQVKIIKQEIIERGFFSTDYVMYTLKLASGNIECKRNYEDFQKLYNILLRIYPGMQIPYLQAKSWFSETNPDNVKRQKIFLQFFLNDILANHELRNSRVIEDFLTIPQHKKIKRKFQQYDRLQKLIGIQHLCLIDGTVSVQISEQTRIYEQMVSKYLASMQNLMDRHRGLSDTLLSQYQSILTTLNSLSNLMKQMEKQTQIFNSRVPFHEIDNLQSIYNKLHLAYKYDYDYKKFQSDELEFKIIPFLKYERDNISTLQNLINIRNAFTKRYQKRLETQSQGRGVIYKNEKLYPYKTGILEESKNLLVMKYQVGYLNNQVCKQSERVLELMGNKFQRKWNQLGLKYLEQFKQNIRSWEGLKIK